MAREKFLNSDRFNVRVLIQRVAGPPLDDRGSLNPCRFDVKLHSAAQPKHQPYLFIPGQ